MTTYYPNEYSAQVIKAREALNEHKHNVGTEHKYYAKHYFKIQNANDDLVICSKRKLTKEEVIKKLLKIRPCLKEGIK